MRGMSHVPSYVKAAKRLSKAAQADPNITANNLVLRNLWMPVYMAQAVLRKTRFENRAEVIEELIAVANFALVRAAHAYDLDRAKKDPGAFTAYAMPTIERDLWAAVGDMRNGPVSTGKYGRELLPKIRGAIAKRPVDAPATPEEIAEELGVHISTVKHLMALIDGVQSLNEPRRDESPDWAIGDAVQDETPGPEELTLDWIHEEERRDELSAALADMKCHTRAAIGLSTGYPAFDTVCIADLIMASRRFNQQGARNRLRKKFQEGEANAYRLGFAPEDATGAKRGARLPSPAPRGQASARIERDSPADIWQRLTDRWRQAAEMDTRQCVGS